MHCVLGSKQYAVSKCAIENTTRLFTLVNGRERLWPQGNAEIFSMLFGRYKLH